MSEEFQLRQVFPGNQGGPVEAAKRAVVMALRQTINGSTHSDQGSVRVDMEYPAKEEAYPSVWVQFSLTRLRNAGMGHEHWTEEGLVREWMYEGRVNLTLLFLSSKERDQMADALITIFAFSRTNSQLTARGVQVEREGGYEYSDFFASLDENPYLSMSLNSDELRPGGQSINVGTPWNEDTLVYEDNYNFDVQGQFETVIDDTGLYRIRRVDLAGGYPRGLGPNPYVPDGSFDQRKVDIGKWNEQPVTLGEDPDQSIEPGSWV